MQGHLQDIKHLSSVPWGSVDGRQTGFVALVPILQSRVLCGDLTLPQIT